ncbi:hypothetical protein BDV93DRAFT_509728 [Ceratobasidium sp. AG-I]|nr:hypothetical protein BDV93DRAFT_509728 [Ceratobasidium sp. AG-I]
MPKAPSPNWSAVVGKRKWGTSFVDPSRQNRPSQTIHRYRHSVTGVSELDVEGIPLTDDTIGSMTAITNHQAKDPPRQYIQATHTHMSSDVAPIPQSSQQSRSARSKDSHCATLRSGSDLEQGQHGLCAKPRQPLPKRPETAPNPEPEHTILYSNSSPPLATAQHAPSSEILNKQLPLVTRTRTGLTQRYTTSPPPTHLGLNLTQQNNTLPRPGLRVIQSSGTEPSCVELTDTPFPQPPPARKRTDLPQVLIRCQGITKSQTKCKRKKICAQGSKYYCENHQPNGESSSQEGGASVKAGEFVRNNKPRQCQGLNKDGTPCGNWALKGDKGFQGFCRHHRPTLPDRSKSASLKSGTKVGTDKKVKKSTEGTTLITENPSSTVEVQTEGVVQGRQVDSAQSKTDSSTSVDGESAHTSYRPPHITDKAWNALLAKMKTPQKLIDEGYIYMCELTNKRTDEHIYVKVGCTKKVKNRVAKWKKTCSLNTFEHRGVWPKRDRNPHSPALGSEGEVYPCPYRYLLEGMIHIAMRDLAKNSGYLPVEHRPQAPVLKKCSTCQVKHKEVHAIGRFKGNNEGERDKKLWDIIEQTIERLARFVASKYGDLSEQSPP